MFRTHKYHFKLSPLIEDKRQEANRGVSNFSWHNQHSLEETIADDA